MPGTKKEVQLEGKNRSGGDKSDGMYFKRARVLNEEKMD